MLQIEHEILRFLGETAVSIRPEAGKAIDLAIKYCVTHSTISDIRNRKRKKPVPDSVA